MRLSLRRLAVTALLAPVAAIGVTTMIATPADAAPADTHPGGGHPGHGRPGHGGWNPGHGGWNPGHDRRGPVWPGPGMPVLLPGQPGQPVEGAPIPEQPVADQPVIVTPIPDDSAPGTPAPVDSGVQGLQDEINRLINVQRTSNGCDALTVNDQLTTAARDHSAWMAQTGTFSHTGSGGSTFVTRVTAAGYAQPSAENIAMGYRSAAEVVDGWMNSPGHRANIVNCQSKTVGVGVANAADGTPYYTQDFGY